MILFFLSDFSLNLAFILGFGKKYEKWLESCSYDQRHNERVRYLLMQKFILCFQARQVVDMWQTECRDKATPHAMIEALSKMPLTASASGI